MDQGRLGSDDSPGRLDSPGSDGRLLPLLLTRGIEGNEGSDALVGAAPNCAEAPTTPATARAPSPEPIFR